jgi:probable F420-dependent oxidoreductase
LTRVNEASPAANGLGRWEGSVRVRYGIDLTNLGDYADARTVVRLAQTAEQAGWEALFVWDHLGFAWGVPSGDPWVILAAVAASTNTLRLGTSVTPLARRRPHVVANQLATLDRLSGGRVVFGAGLGGVGREFAAFGEADDARERAARLDEGLAVLTRLLSGEEATHRGARYTVDGVALAPPPVQRPRVPIWIGGHSPAALRRAARWDGWLPAASDEQGQVVLAPERLAAGLATIRQHRAGAGPFEVAVIGQSAPDNRALRQEYAAAGATWWLEILHGFRGPLEEMVALAAAGPPA